MADADNQQQSPKFGSRLKSLWSQGLFIASRAAILLLGLPFLLSLLYVVIPPPISNYMIIKSFSGNGLDYRFAPLSRISKHLPRAVVAAEDTRFCEHDGLEWQALGQAVQDAFNPDSGRGGGASTITMQVARNLFLWPGRSYLRKAIEIPLAFWLDLVWSKRRILEIYLNIAEFGPGVYGAEAAARYHFNKSASALNGREALRLAAVLPNPIKRIASNPSAGVRHYAQRIQRRVAGTEPFYDCLGLKDR